MKLSKKRYERIRYVKECIWLSVKICKKIFKYYVFKSGLIVVYTIGKLQIIILHLVADQATYTMFRSTGDGTSDATAVYGVDDVLEASYRNSNVDTPLTKINRSQYQALSNKTSTGTPSQYFVQRFIDKITITLYLTPGSSVKQVNL